MSEQFDHYSVVIQWSVPDNVYIARVPELPGCETHGSTYEEAIQRIQEVIELWIDASKEWGKPIAAPSVLLAS